MNVTELKNRQDIPENSKLNRTYNQLRVLLNALKIKDLPQHIVASVNQDIEELNSTILAGNELQKFVKQKRSKILRMLARELKIVTTNYYRDLWLSLGVSFGLSIGVLVGLLTDNPVWPGMGLLIGITIWISTGSGMDEKASKEGRQLIVETN